MNVPWLVRLCSDAMLEKGICIKDTFIHDLGITLEGIFRVPGSASGINAICNAFLNGPLGCAPSTHAVRWRSRLQCPRQRGDLGSLEKVSPRIACSHTRRRDT